MRALFLHPEDSPLVGPWSRERWDLIVDLGKSSEFSADHWSKQHGCPVVRSERFCEGVSDVRRVRDILSAGMGRVIDEEGLDWWELTSLLLAPEVLTVLTFRRLITAIPAEAELWATRAADPLKLLSILLGRHFRVFGTNWKDRAGARLLRYAGLARRFSARQIMEIFFDKYDPGYRLRSRYTRRPDANVKPVVLVPTAYENVSRTAAAYARLLPDQSFLFVVTRRSGEQFVRPPNVQVRELAAYARSKASQKETHSLCQRWMSAKSELSAVPDLDVLIRAGALEPLADWIVDGISVRNGWREVLDHEPVSSVLCGDDSNRYTVLPVLLAARRKIPTIDFHHGAFDGRYLLKNLHCDFYLAKNEMERDYLVRLCGLPAERIVLGAPSLGAPSPRPFPREGKVPGGAAMFFSEPYEGQGARCAEVYREVLPPLCAIAREHGRRVMVKLHPFESKSQRENIVREVLAPEDSAIVAVVDGPLTEQLWARAWLGVTVESTCVMDCLLNGVPCFLCDWLKLAPFEYAAQYARFGVGEALRSAAEMAGISARVAAFEPRPEMQSTLWAAADPALLKRYLTGGSLDRAVTHAAHEASTN